MSETLAFHSSASASRNAGPSSAARERRRVARHIRRAESQARNRDVASLDPLRRLVRALLLDELAQYRAEGRFPLNRDFAEQTPFFIDGDGTRCAMAHLLEVGGESALVNRIATERNNAWVRELADEPRLLAWLDAAGLTVEEAAAIQPSYCSTNSECICGGSFSYVGYPVPAEGVIEGVVESLTTDGTAVARIDMVHGQVGAYAVGDQFVASNVYNVAVGTRVVAPVARGDGGTNATTDGGVASIPAVAFSSADTYSCHSQGVGNAPPVTRAQFIAAVQSSDCAGTLATYDHVWQQDSCGHGGGCAVSPGVAAAAPTTLGILLALVAVMSARRMRRAQVSARGRVR